jgi:hypothetical protein
VINVGAFSSPMSSPSIAMEVSCPGMRARSCLIARQGAQVCKSGVTRLRKIWLTRHGESEYNRKALLGGDSNITDSGRKYAAVLPDIVVDRIPLARPAHPLAVCLSYRHALEEVSRAARSPLLTAAAADLHEVAL